MPKVAAVFLTFALLVGCGETVTGTTDSRILLLGDSMMASNATGNQSVADGLEAILQEDVIDRSAFGARYFYYLPISGAAGLRLDAQYRPGNWDLIVLNGGGNDLLFGCGCQECASLLTRLITPDGKGGAIPDFVAHLHASGARILYVGYLRNPGTATPIRACRSAGDDLDQRLARMASLTSDVDFIDLSDLVPHGDPSFHGFDGIHPSPKGSRAIAARIAAFVQ